MPLLSISDSSQWDGFMASQPWSQFTQSWAWGEFRASRGEAVERLALTREDPSTKSVPSSVEGRGARPWDAAAQFVHYPKPLVGGYWYSPRGPVVRSDLADQSGEIVGRFMDELVRRGLPRRALFWRIEPPYSTAHCSLTTAGLVRSHAYMPASTLLIDVSKSEDELLREMHEKTRYNIRVAERNGVTVRSSTASRDLDIFLRLNDETAMRDRFVSQPSAYIRATFDFLQSRGMMRVRIAEREGAALAASLEVTYGDTRTYLYGASSSTHRNFMAPYALHWDAIRTAKLDGHRFYDFHGVNPADESSPSWKGSWAGITRFKLGWGGGRRDLVGTWERPFIRVAYRLFRMIGH